MGLVVCGNNLIQCFKEPRTNPLAEKVASTPSAASAPSASKSMAPIDLRGWGENEYRKAV
jgi:hypothetical protein